MHTSKIADSPLFAAFGALAMVWLVLVVGLSLTIKREFLSTFVSLQTGSGFVENYFLENERDNFRRVQIFFSNARKWIAIRQYVREWMLGVYEAWLDLMPAWLTMDLQARIPDDFMPAAVVQDLNARARDGRRPTLGNHLLMRASLRREFVDGEMNTMLLPVWAQPGCKVLHPTRGPGIIARIDTLDLRGKPIVVEYANDEVHHYSVASAGKLRVVNTHGSSFRTALSTESGASAATLTCSSETTSAATRPLGFQIGAQIRPHAMRAMLSPVRGSGEGVHDAAAAPEEEETADEPEAGEIDGSLSSLGVSAIVAIIPAWPAPAALP